MSKKRKIVFFSENSIKNTYLTEFLKNSINIQKIQKTSTSVRGTNAMFAEGTKAMLTNSDLALLSKTKSFIKKNVQMHNIFYEHYKSFGSRLNTYCQVDNNYEQFFNTMEVDISSCYINTARLFNVISEDIYEQFAKLSKEKRLKLFGAIAAKKTVYEYESGILLNEQKINPEPVLSLAWAYIVNKTFEVLCSNIIPKIRSFQFFWVDAFFFTDRSETEVIQSEIEKIGYPSKSIELDYSFYHLENLKNSNKFVKKFVFKPKSAKEKYICLPFFNIQP